MTTLTPIEDLRNEYAHRFGRYPNRNWKRETIEEKLREDRQREAEEQRRRAEAQAELDRLAAEREQRAAERRTLAEFADNFDRDLIAADYPLWHAARWANDVLEGHENIARYLGEKFAKDPAHTMEWGDQYFTRAAHWKVALDFKDVFENGLSKQEIVDTFTREVLRRAASSSRSTSATSNLMEDRLRASYAGLLEKLTGR